MRIRLAAVLVAIGAALAVSASVFFGPQPLSKDAFDAQYAVAVAPRNGSAHVYHLGHSLVGRDMPSMLSQLAGGHEYASQLGWGAPMRGHWVGEVQGFEIENAHPRFQPVETALASGRFDTFVVTEMVEIKDAIKYHDSAKYLALWAKRTRASNPDMRVYLYETWHSLDDPYGWLERIDGDLESKWEAELLRPAMAEDGVGTIYVIPGGQVMAAVVREMEAGRVPGMTRREELFGRADDGSQDQIHFNDKGAYLMALVHYAVIYGTSPVGLPHALKRADGTLADAPSAEAARIMQEVVWKVVTGYGPTGVGRKPAG